MIKLLELLQEKDSEAEIQAKQQGLEYMSFGRWGKDGHVTHTTQNGKLVPVKKGTPKASPSTPTASPKSTTQGHGKDFIGTQGRGIAPKQPKFSVGSKDDDGAFSISKGKQKLGRVRKEDDGTWSHEDPRYPQVWVDSGTKKDAVADLIDISKEPPETPKDKNSEPTKTKVKNVKLKQNKDRNKSISVYRRGKEIGKIWADDDHWAIQSTFSKKDGVYQASSEDKDEAIEDLISDYDIEKDTNDEFSS